MIKNMVNMLVQYNEHGDILCVELLFHMISLINDHSLTIKSFLFFIYKSNRDLCIRSNKTIIQYTHTTCKILDEMKKY